MKALYLVPLIALTACSSVRKYKTTDGAHTLTNTTWFCKEAKGEKVDKSAGVLTLNFNDSTKTVGGFGGCNSFGGHYETDGVSSLKTSQILSTMKACIGKQNVEGKILNTLDQVDQYSIVGDTLYLKVNGETWLKYTAKK